VNKGALSSVMELSAPYIMRVRSDGAAKDGREAAGHFFAGITAGHRGT